MGARTTSHRALLLALRLATFWLKLDAFVGMLERRYRPDQPRVPAGSPDGGQWTAAGGARPRSLDHVAQAVTGFRKHGSNLIISRGLSPVSILDALQNPLKIRVRSNGTTQYVGTGATVVLNADGEVVTAWPQ